VFLTAFEIEISRYRISAAHLTSPHRTTTLTRTRPCWRASLGESRRRLWNHRSQHSTAIFSAKPKSNSLVDDVDSVAVAQQFCRVSWRTVRENPQYRRAK
jgi:hypothetical protein